MKRAAIYARYSSALQRPASIADQEEICRQAAARWGYTVSEEHMYRDEEINGSLAARPGYQRLLAAARARAFDAVIVEAQDRLWRDQAEMHAALRRLRFWGVRVLSVETGGDLTDRAGSIVASVLGWRDEAFLDGLREKTRRGLAGQVRRGYSAGGRAYGYRTEPVTDPSRTDPHGQPVVVGYRRVVHEREAAVVRRIFELYAAGWSPRRIARALNAERIPPPRGPSWTWTAIYGSPRLGTGILNNPLYIGQVIWNKFRWEKNPDTGKRVPRVRPRDEWIMLDDETLRIVPQELWDAVRDRRLEERRVTPPRRTGRPGVYLFSGLLRCARCGARYVIRSHDRYACAGYLDRGPTVCENAQTVRRQVVESRLLEVIERELFAPEAIAYITERVNRELQALVRQRRSSLADRKQLEAELVAALAELDRIREAIRRGLISDLTREMLEEAEARARRLRAELLVPTPSELLAVRVLPQVVAEKLRDLRRVLDSDVKEARAILRELIGEVTIHQTAEGPVAELTGNIQGLLALGPQPLRVINMVAGGGFEPPTFGL